MVAFMGLPGGSEWFVILIIALLLFGSRLPSVMRSLGRSLTEFKKGIHEAEDDITSAAQSAEDEEGDDSASPVG